MSEPAHFEVRDPSAANEVAPERDFYVGDAPRVPRGLRVHLQVIYFSLVLLAAAVAFVLAVAQNPAPPSHYGFSREFEGIITLRPYPSLLLETPGVESARPQLRRRMLVGEWPGSVGAEIEDAVGQYVRLRGRLIYRAGLTLVEVESGSLEVLRRAPPGLQPIPHPLGLTRLRGYVWDARCYLGAMRPGAGPAHRGCSVRNIREGIAPLFVATLPDGGEELYIMRSPTGGPLGDEVLRFVGLPVYALGLAEDDGGVLHFRTDPAESMLILGRGLDGGPQREEE